MTQALYAHMNNKKINKNKKIKNKKKGFFLLANLHSVVWKRNLKTFNLFVTMP
jgi:hypothetical protein